MALALRGAEHFACLVEHHSDGAEDVGRSSRYKVWVRDRTARRCQLLRQCSAERQSPDSLFRLHTASAWEAPLFFESARGACVWSWGVAGRYRGTARQRIGVPGSASRRPCWPSTDPNRRGTRPWPSKGASTVRVKPLLSLMLVAALAGCSPYVLAAK